MPMGRPRFTDEQRQASAERAKVRRKEWRARHPEKCAEYTRRSKAKKPEAYAKRKRDWEKKNQEHFIKHRTAYLAKYYKDRQKESVEKERRRREDQRIRLLWMGARTRARRLGLPFALLERDIVIPMRCPVLGIPLRRNVGVVGPSDGSPTLDRIVPKLGYVPGNVAVISFRANALKRDGTLKEVEAIARYLRRHHKRSKTGETPQLRLVLGDAA